MDPKKFETVYVRRDFVENEVTKMIQAMDSLEYQTLNEYDKGGVDGYKQGITELMKRIQSKLKKIT